jgi:hypothetical protein
MDWSHEHDLLRSHGVELAPGLSDAELAAAEDRVGCRFPPDLRSFLRAALPVGKGWPDWRNPDSPEIADRLDWAAKGMEFDLEHCPWWWPPPWGPRPDDLGEAIRVARAHLLTVPRLIPVFNHRFLPAEPEEAGNPVLSVWQMVDTIYYGRDLRDYFTREFSHRSELLRESVNEVRRIRFWGDVVETWYQEPAKSGMTADLIG